MIYFVTCAEKRLVKIGHSLDPVKRISALRTSSAFPLELASVIDGTKDDEARLHDQFAHLRLNGEWFELSGDLEEHIETLPKFVSRKDQMAFIRQMEMVRPEELGRREVESIEARALSVRKSMTELCQLAGLSYVTFWRWKKTGKPTAKGLRALDRALEPLEAALN